MGFDRTHNKVSTRSATRLRPASKKLLAVDPSATNSYLVLADFTFVTMEVRRILRLWSSSNALLFSNNPPTSWHMPSFNR